MDAEASDTHFFAHSTLKADRSDWQPLVEHLQAVARLAGEKAAFFGGGELAALAGLLHDLGKYTDEFQRRIAGDAIRVDHTSRGAILAVERYGALGQLLAYGIAGHHAGLANGREAGERTALADRLKGVDLPRLLETWHAEIELPDRLQPPPLKPRPGRGFFQLAFLGRMLFSCLVDADYLDTEAFYDRTEGRRSLREQARPSLAELRAALDGHLAEFKGDTLVNLLRGEILAGVRGKANEQPGLFPSRCPQEAVRPWPPSLSLWITRWPTVCAA
ncbi:CRISPR-associated helicase Cas3 domain-containing protein [Pseudomonas aeruginosa]|nr:CRISPR-associated helicase Cas3 domain-containing protein [Pseudomonas aeruginosa]